MPPRSQSQALLSLVETLCSPNSDQVQADALVQLALIVDFSYGEEAAELCELLRRTQVVDRIIEFIDHPESLIHQTALLLLGNLCTDAVDPQSMLTKNRLKQINGFPRLIPHIFSDQALTVAYALGAIQNTCTDIEYVALMQQTGAIARIQDLIQCDQQQIVNYAEAVLHNVMETVMTVSRELQLTKAIVRIQSASRRWAATRRVAVLRAEKSQERIAAQKPPIASRAVDETTLAEGSGANLSMESTQPQAGTMGAALLHMESAPPKNVTVGAGVLPVEKTQSAGDLAMERAHPQLDAGVAGDFPIESTQPHIVAEAAVDSPMESTPQIATNGAGDQPMEGAQPPIATVSACAHPLERARPQIGAKRAVGLSIESAQVQFDTEDDAADLSMESTQPQIGAEGAADLSMKQPHQQNFTVGSVEKTQSAGDLAMESAHPQLDAGVARDFPIEITQAQIGAEAAVHSPMESTPSQIDTDGAGDQPMESAQPPIATESGGALPIESTQARIGAEAAADLPKERTPPQIAADVAGDQPMERAQPPIATDSAGALSIERSQAHIGAEGAVDLPMERTAPQIATDVAGDQPMESAQTPIATVNSGDLPMENTQPLTETEFMRDLHMESTQLPSTTVGAADLPMRSKQQQIGADGVHDLSIESTRPQVDTERVLHVPKESTQNQIATQAAGRRLLVESAQPQNFTVGAHDFSMQSTQPQIAAEGTIDLSMERVQPQNVIVGAGLLPVERPQSAGDLAMDSAHPQIGAGGSGDFPIESTQAQIGAEGAVDSPMERAPPQIATDAGDQPIESAQPPIATESAGALPMEIPQPQIVSERAFVLSMESTQPQFDTEAAADLSMKGPQSQNVTVGAGVLSVETSQSAGDLAMESAHPQLDAGVALDFSIESAQAQIGAEAAVDSPMESTTPQIDTDDAGHKSMESAQPPIATVSGGALSLASVQSQIGTGVAGELSMESTQAQIGAEDAVDLPMESTPPQIATDGAGDQPMEGAQPPIATESAGAHPLESAQPQLETERAVGLSMESNQLQLAAEGAGGLSRQSTQPQISAKGAANLSMEGPQSQNFTMGSGVLPVEKTQSAGDLAMETARPQIGAGVAGDLPIESTQSQIGAEAAVRSPMESTSPQIATDGAGDKPIESAQPPIATESAGVIPMESAQPQMVTERAVGLSMESAQPQFDTETAADLSMESSQPQGPAQGDLSLESSQSQIVTEVADDLSMEKAQPQNVTMGAGALSVERIRSAGDLPMERPLPRIGAEVAADLLMGSTQPQIASDDAGDQLMETSQAQNVSESSGDLLMESATPQIGTARSVDLSMHSTLQQNDTEGASDLSMQSTQPQISTEGAVDFPMESAQPQIATDGDGELSMEVVRGLPKESRPPQVATEGAEGVGDCLREIAQPQKGTGHFGDFPVEITQPQTAGALPKEIARPPAILGAGGGLSMESEQLELPQEATPPSIISGEVLIQSTVKPERRALISLETPKKLKRQRSRPFTSPHWVRVHINVESLTCPSTAGHQLNRTIQAVPLEETVREPREERKNVVVRAEVKVAQSSAGDVNATSAVEGRAFEVTDVARKSATRAHVRLEWTYMPSDSRRQLKLFVEPLSAQEDIRPTSKLVHATVILHPEERDNKVPSSKFQLQENAHAASGRIRIPQSGGSELSPHALTARCRVRIIMETDDEAYALEQALDEKAALIQSAARGKVARSSTMRMRSETMQIGPTAVCGAPIADTDTPAATAATVENMNRETASKNEALVSTIACENTMDSKKPQSGDSTPLGPTSVCEAPIADTDTPAATAAMVENMDRKTASKNEALVSTIACEKTMDSKKSQGGDSTPLAKNHFSQPREGRRAKEEHMEIAKPRTTTSSSRLSERPSHQRAESTIKREKFCRFEIELCPRNGGATLNIRVKFAGDSQGGSQLLVPREVAISQDSSKICTPKEVAMPQSSSRLRTPKELAISQHSSQQHTPNGQTAQTKQVSQLALTKQNLHPGTTNSLSSAHMSHSSLMHFPARRDLVVAPTPASMHRQQQHLKPPLPPPSTFIKDSPATSTNTLIATKDVLSLECFTPNLLPDIARTLQQIVVYRAAMRNTRMGIGTQSRYKATSRLNITPYDPSKPPAVIKLLKPRAVQELGHKYARALKEAEEADALAASCRAVWTQQRREEVLQDNNAASEKRAQKQSDFMIQRALDHERVSRERIKDSDLLHAHSDAVASLMRTARKATLPPTASMPSLRGPFASASRPLTSTESSTARDKVVLEPNIQNKLVLGEKPTACSASRATRKSLGANPLKQGPPALPPIALKSISGEVHIKSAPSLLLQETRKSDHSQQRSTKVRGTEQREQTAEQALTSKSLRSSLALSPPREAPSAEQASPPKSMRAGLTLSRPREALSNCFEAEGPAELLFPGSIPKHLLRPIVHKPTQLGRRVKQRELRPLPPRGALSMAEVLAKDDDA